MSLRREGDVATILDRTVRPQPVAIPVLVFLALAAGLVLAVEFPPLLDYANHYARLWLIAGGISEDPFPQIYALDWKRTFTNIGIDLMALWLGPVIGVPLLAKLLLFLAIVLPPLGAIALHRQIFGGSYHWQVAILYFAWCATMIAGFINFQIGLGLALVCAGIDLRLQRRHWTVLFAWRLAAALLLTVTHLFSTGFYLALVCGLEYGPVARPLARGLWRPGLRMLAATVACLLPVLALFAFASSLPGAEATDASAAWNDTPLLILFNLLTAISTYVAVIDVLFLIPIILVCSSAIRSKDLRRHAGLMITAGGLLLIACIAPRHAYATGWIGWRFPIMACLSGMAMICPFPVVTRRQGLWLMIVLNLAVFGRTGWIGFTWWQQKADVANVETLLQAVPAGAAVLPLMHWSAPGATGLVRAHRAFMFGQDTFRHLPTLAIPLARAFVPTLFTAKGKQPLKVLPPWSQIAVPEGNLASVALLDCPALARAYRPYWPYLENWRRHFDYVLVLNTDLPDRFVATPRLAGLSLLQTTDFAALYAVRKDSELSETPDPQTCPADLGDAT